MSLLSGNRITRRALLRIAAAIAALVPVPASARVWFRLPPRGMRLIYFLDPNCASVPATCNHPTDTPLHSCNVCYACISHAANKRWATTQAITRAHPCCRCTVKSTYVPLGVFYLMFGRGTQFSQEFDKRWGFVH